MRQKQACIGAYSNANAYDSNVVQQEEAMNIDGGCEQQQFDAFQDPAVQGGETCGVLGHPSNDQFSKSLENIKSMLLPRSRLDSIKTILRKNVFKTSDSRLKQNVSINFNGSAIKMEDQQHQNASLHQSLISRQPSFDEAPPYQNLKTS